MSDTKGNRMMKAVRWGDADHYFGPFTWSYSSAYPHWSITLGSHGDEDGDSWAGRSVLHVHLGKATMIAAVPGIIRPWRQKRYPGWDADTVQRLGRDWYWEVDHRRYGFSYSDGFLQVFYGRCGGACEDSSKQQQWSCFVPWRSWRHVRRSLYGLQGELFETVPERAAYETWKALEEACPVVRFSFEDYDGKVIVATTRIEEREWRLGAGSFKWLSWFRRPKIIRSLNLEFSDEVGPEKGSWKGGTVGHSIDMLPGELHEAAFRRYCEKEHRAKGRRYRIKFLMPVAA